MNDIYYITYLLQAMLSLIPNLNNFLSYYSRYTPAIRSISGILVIFSLGLPLGLPASLSA